MNNLIPLDHLKQGQAAQIGTVLGQADHVHRLHELGLRGGSRIEVFRPGNPCIVRIAGNKVCIRSDHRLRVMVQPQAAPC